MFNQQDYFDKPPSRRTSTSRCIRLYGQVTVAGGQLRTLRLAGNQFFRASLRDQKASTTTTAALTFIRVLMECVYVCDDCGNFKPLKVRSYHDRPDSESSNHQTDATRAVDKESGTGGLGVAFMSMTSGLSVAISGSGGGLCVTFLNARYCQDLR